MTTTIGLLAGFLTTISFLPQLHRTVRTRSTDDFSWAYLLLFGTGIATWVGYGALTADVAIVLPNCVMLLLLLGIAAVKVVNAVRRRQLGRSPTAGEPATRSV